jgi:hypothetical protein
VNCNRTHTVRAVDRADIVAGIAGMIGTLGTRKGHNCLMFDSKGSRCTIVWRLTDHDSGYAVSFRDPPADTELGYYKTAGEAAEAIHLGHHTEAAWDNGAMDIRLDCKLTGRPEASGQ